MILVLILLILWQPVFSFPVGILLGIWVCAITLWSGADYFVKNRSVF